MDTRPFHIKQLIVGSWTDGDGTRLSASSTLEDAVAFLEEVAQTRRPNPCPQCGTSGTINPPLDADGDPTRCPLCTGYGYTFERYEAVVSSYRVAQN